MPRECSTLRRCIQTTQRFDTFWMRLEAWPVGSCPCLSASRNLLDNAGPTVTPTPTRPKTIVRLCPEARGASWWI